jgi:methylmalonyl-CoA mutase
MKDHAHQDELFSSFTPVSKETWRKAASAEIEGKDPFETLQWGAASISGHPYYNKEDLVGKTYLESFALPSLPEEYGQPRHWLNLPVISVLDEQQANKKALQSLTHGADGILFDLRKKTVVSLPKLLNAIEWPYCSVCFHLTEATEQFLENLASYVTDKKFKPNSLSGFYLSETYPQHPQVLHKAIHNLNGYEKYCLAGIHSQHEDPVNEISDILEKAVSLIDQLQRLGIEAETVIRKLFFSTIVGSDFFLEIAKLKALRILWFHVVRAYGISNYQPSDLFLAARSTAWHHSSLEPHENMLKGTTASLAAILGGCNALTTDPADEQDERSFRIALNVSNVLREESHLGKVADPVAGSYYVDHMVHSIARSAWKQFTLKVCQP